MINEVFGLLEGTVVKVMANSNDATDQNKISSNDHRSYGISSWQTFPLDKRT